METNIQTNKEYYDQLYGQTKVQEIVYRARNFEAFLDNAIKTDTSWHGMYQGGYKDRLAGKRVLELGAGDGLNSAIMALLGAKVIAIDISDGTGTIISEINTQLGTRIDSFTGDFLLMNFQPESFDFVIGKAFLHHLTHELEEEYLCKVARLLRKDGEARFFEPAVNSMVLDKIRWMVPVPDRPSIFNKRAFRTWKSNDPHPARDNSSDHFRQIGKQYFGEVNIVLIGSIERFYRLIPDGKINRRFRRWAHRVEPYLPAFFRYFAARSQLIVFRKPLG